MARKITLAQVLASEPKQKDAEFRVMNEAFKTFQKPSDFTGMTREFRPKDEDGEQLPEERQRVKYNADELLRRACTAFATLMNIEATKCEGNMNARADIVIGDEVLATDVPAETLLHLEKQLKQKVLEELKTLPILDPVHEWTMDENSGLHRTEPIKTSRTQKVPTPIVLLPQTEHQQGKAELVMQDVNVGVWEQVFHSGAVSPARKRRLLARCLQVIEAVSHARQTANQVEAPRQDVGSVVVEALLSV